MNRDRLPFLVVAVLGVTAGVFLFLGALGNLILLPLSLPFGAGAYVVWGAATGRRPIQWVRIPGVSGEWTGAADRGPRRGRSRRARRARARTRRRDHGVPNQEPPGERIDRTEALDVLGLEPGADETTIRQAYRDRVKEVHPDTDGGDQEAFKRVTGARDRLLDAE